MKRAFKRPVFEVVYFDGGVLATSNCACYDPDFCPVDYKNCTGDGAICSCEINYNPALDNCICTKNN